MKNLLTLKKCAYIFHWSNDNYFYGTKADHEKKTKINKLLKEYYNNETLRNTPIEFNVSANSTFNIVLDNETIVLNDNMIDKIVSIDPAITIINNTVNVINNIKYKDFSGLSDNKLFDSRCFDPKDNLYSKKFSTLNIENFMYKDSLTFYRIHFKNNSYCFVIDNDNNLYNFYGSKYKLINKKDIKKSLYITSDNAIKEFNMIMDYLLS